MTIVRDVMSYGVLTVPADAVLSSLLGRLRRIGHEGYPVLEANKLVGLLTARDMNRAAENGLEMLPVRDVMLEGSVFVSPDSPVRRLPLLMLESGWGQIPVIADGEIVGIVTRTDVLTHYARKEAQRPSTRNISHAEVHAALGEPIAALIAFVAQQAHAQQRVTYIVGGAVRDLLLKRANTDIDFVLEGDAIQFAQYLQGAFGGSVKAHEAFGTATWSFDAASAQAIGQPLDALPPYVDLVTARHEFYEEPAVLPTVYHSSIKLDLRRRDFTINALAIELNGIDAGGELIDLFNGLTDLQNGVIRALHSLSFADDPTRTLRAVRFAHRLGFTLEPRTAALIQTALPMMRRITGERLRNELSLILQEPKPHEALAWLQSMNVLSAIHSGFVVDVAQLAHGVAQLADAQIPMRGDLAWLMLGASLPPQQIHSLAERLLIKRSLIAEMHAIANITQHPQMLLMGKRSQITAALDALPLDAVSAAQYTVQEMAQRATLQSYLSTWRQVKPFTDGNALKARGLPASPLFKRVLMQLRAAHLDGEIRTAEEEAAYLDQLLRSE